MVKVLQAPTERIAIVQQEKRRVGVIGAYTNLDGTLQPLYWGVDRLRNDKHKQPVKAKKMSYYGYVMDYQLFKKW